MKGHPCTTTIHVQAYPTHSTGRARKSLRAGLPDSILSGPPAPKHYTPALLAQAYPTHTTAGHSHTPGF
eukprot:3920536-Karenia_brevis.AAC.1